MPNPNETEIRNWLLKNYPFEAVFIDEITRQVNDMYQHLQVKESFKDNEPLKFEITKRKETGYLELQTNLSSMVFLGGMARAISNVLISDILPMLLKMRIKKCVICNVVNQEEARYCMNCGNQFNS